MTLKRRGLKTSPFLFILNTNMKNLINQYFWIIAVTSAVLLVGALTFPDKKNRLEFIEEEINKVQAQQKILTEKERELEKLATEKEWAEVDKNSDK